MGRSRGRTRNLARLLFSFLISLSGLALSPANAQQTGPAPTPESNNPIPEVRTTLGAGNLPSSVFDPSSLIRQNLPGAAKTSPAPAQLSLTNAIQLALQNNLATLTAQEQRREATGFVQQARSALLPNIFGATYQASLTINLAALGFQSSTFPGISTFIGPFNNFDARTRLVQTIFDLSAIRNYQSSREQAYGIIYGMVARQAMVLSYIDNFRMLAFLCLLCVRRCFCSNGYARNRVGWRCTDRLSIEIQAKQRCW